MLPYLARLSRSSRSTISPDPSLTPSVFKGLDEFAGLELALPATLRPVPVDLATHKLAKDLADCAVAGSGAEVSPHLVGDLNPRHPISALAPRGRVRRPLGPTSVAAAASATHAFRFRIVYV
jgi:hypothetical protein